MRKTTITIPAIEMSKEEELQLWRDIFFEGKNVESIMDWDTSDGNNRILFRGENSYRQVVRKGN